MGDHERGSEPQTIAYFLEGAQPFLTREKV